ncbi:MAG: Fur family transcriptional regulator [Planctomycetota bacterium]
MVTSKQPRDTGADLQHRCRELGVPVTPQRLAVFAALAAREDHPSAEQIFDDLRAARAGISMATAYRTLDKLVELGLVVRVSHPSSVARYDAKTWRHHHLICQECGAVTDLESGELDRVVLPDVARLGFAVRDFSISVHGRCRQCNRANRGSKGRATPARVRATPPASKTNHPSKRRHP